MKSSIIFFCTLTASIFGWGSPNVTEKDIPGVFETSEIGQEGSSDFSTKSRDIAKGKAAETREDPGGLRSAEQMSAANRLESEDKKYEAKPQQNQSQYFIHERSMQVPGSNGILNEEIPPARNFAEFSSVITHQKNFLYGSLSIVPGGGIASRNREGLKGTSLDYKVGVFPFVFDTVTLIPVLSVDYNYLHFFKMNETSPYLSYGIGAAYVVPYIPLRAGIEFKHGFVDIGAKMVLGFIPSPEIRAGVDLKF